MHHASFLPEDYLAQKAERRTNLICLTLFVVVMIAVFGAFLVTNRQWTHVKRSQEAINARYREAAKQIQDLTELESQREQMLEKAELAAALVERVPRSILFAELINRMPDRMALTNFELESEQIRTVRSAGPKRQAARRGSVRRPRTREQVSVEPPKSEPPRYQVKLSMTGTAPTDLEVSHFMSELNAYSLLSSVTLDYSEEKEINDRVMRQFKIHMELDPTADVRSVDALAKPRRVKDPTSDQLRLGSGGGR
ncbi:MAG: PilN domain-containing protein, partial [Planctomycetota bacterium]